uniref:Uncharacterized protein n=1 Tax=Anguilla anguilla TaxID=7936 RepID=A0A0E9VP95_ANGAN
MSWARRGVAFVS